MNYTEKGNLSGLIELTSISSMLLPKHWESVLIAARQLNKEITNAIGNQRWHKVRVHRVDLRRYGQKGSMELLQKEIFHGGDSHQLG